MTLPQVKRQLSALIDKLPPDQAELVLDFAVLLHQRQPHSYTHQRSPDAESVSDWEMALVTAETYWFQLPESKRKKYGGRIVALLYDRILDSDTKLRDLRARMVTQHPNQPILYLDADSEPEPALFIRSPRLR